MKKLIVETHDRFPKKVFDKEEKILEFNRQNLNLVKDANGNLIRLKKSDSWICVITEERLIEKVKKHPSLGSKFWIVNKVPTKDSEAATIIRSGAVSSGEMDASIKAMKAKAMKFGELKAKVLKSDGTFLASATPNQIEEFKSLEEELNEGD